MCGIVGYVGQRDAADVLMDGLSRLEYRGYDSAGIAVFDMPSRHVPDAGAFAVLVPRAFYLRRGAGRSPEKLFRK